MLKISPIFGLQPSINMADDEFGRGDSGEDKTKILSTFFVTKKSTKTGYLIFGAKKDD